MANIDKSTSVSKFFEATILEPQLHAQYNQKTKKCAFYLALSTHGGGGGGCTHVNKQQCGRSLGVNEGL